MTMTLPELPKQALADIIAALRKDLRGALLDVATQNAIFKATVSEGHRITIPEAERQALGLKTGDLVQVVVIPLKKE